MLIEEAGSAWRRRASDGQVLENPAWADLDGGARRTAFEEALVMRLVEAPLDPDGYSTTVHAVARAIAEA